MILVAPRLRQLVPNSRIDRLISMATNEPVLSGLVDHGTEAGMDPAEMNRNKTSTRLSWILGWMLMVNVGKTLGIIRIKKFNFTGTF